MTATREPVARKQEIPPGTTRRVVVNGADILLCNVGGNLYAVEDVCSHDGGALDQGELEDNRIMCPRHGAYFDVRTGEALTLPAVMPVRTYVVSINDDDVFIDS